MKKLRFLLKISKKQKYLVLSFTILFFLLMPPRVFANKNTQSRINLNFKNKQLVEIVDHIEATTRYRFLYQSPDLDLERIVSIRYQGDVQTAINILFKHSNIEALVSGNQIILKKKPEKKEVLKISGIVSTEDGGVLPGANVLINDFERGTSTDKNGAYTIKAYKGDKISFCFIGFKTEHQIIKKEGAINLILKEDLSQLDEVIIGYGRQKRTNVSSAISSIDGQTIQTNLQSGSSFDRGLEGLLKGVLITQGTGELGRNPDIIIRGITSPFLETENTANTNNPLFVIDGVQIATGGINFNPLQAINPEDIESVDVLKDAAATAIYGSRGANGVIIVKTRSGNYNQPTTVSISYNTTIAKPIKTLDYLNAKEFKEYILSISQKSYDYYKEGKDLNYWEQLKLLKKFGFYQDGYDDDGYEKFKYDPSRIKFYNGDTDWNKEVYRNPAVSNQVTASVTGGGEKSFYGLSISYTNKEGLLKADKKEQYNARLNYTFNIGRKLKISTAVNYSNSEIKTGFSNSSENSFAFLGSGVLRFRPDLPVYDKNGNFTNDNTGTENNPIYKVNPLGMTTLSSQKTQLNHSILANIFGEYDITKDLMFKVEYGFMASFDDTKDLRPRKYDMDGYDKYTPTKLFIESVKLLNHSVNYTLNYDKTFNKHQLIGVIGFSNNMDKITNSYTAFSDFLSGTTEPQFSKNVTDKDIATSPSGLNSYLGRVIYNYAEKYGIMGTVRADRSSKFASENRNAIFPSISAHWNIHKENFMNKELWRELKIRLSYGHTGSVSVGDFSYLQTYDNKGTTSYNGGNSVFFSQFFANKGLKWERTKEYNLGVDFRLKNNILRGGIDLYHKTTYDVVSNDTELVETGTDEFSRNSATIENKGFEIDLSSDIINKEDFGWTININASKNNNKVLKVSDEIKKDNFFSRYYVVGREVNVIKGHIVNGIIQDKARIDKLNIEADKKGHSFYDAESTGPGDYEYKDINGDGTIDAKDLTIIGSRQPDLFGGFNSRFRYKGIHLGLFFSYALGLQSLRLDEDFNFNKFLNIERYLSPKYRWSPQNKTANLPRLIHRSKDPNNKASDRNVFDASYIRLTSVRLGYDLPNHIIDYLGLRRINLYIAATNLKTWTSFPGLDPQGTIGGRRSTNDTDNVDAYPGAKSYSIGINIHF